MADGKLILIRPHDGTGRLVLNDDTETVAPAAQIGVDATFADDMPASVQLLWSANVFRGEVHHVASHWQQGEQAGHRAESQWQNSQPTGHRTESRWQDGAGAAGRAQTHWQSSQGLGSRAGSHWQDGEHLRVAMLARYQEAIRLRSSAATHWQDGEHMRSAMLARYQEAIRLRSAMSTRWQDGTPRGTRHGHRGRAGLPLHRSMGTHWQDARRPPVGLSVIGGPVTPPVEPCYDPATLGRLELVDAWSNSGRLVLVCIRGTDPEGPAAPVFILPARFYMTAHSLEAHRLPDLAPVPIFDASISAEAGAYGWTFSASAPASAFEQLAPSSGLPAQIRITLDGIPFSFVVDSLTRTEQFGQRRVRLAGRSITALLGRPFSRETQRTNTAPFTAQQLALQALEFTGVGLNWGLTDWLVPAGAWSHSGTPLAAVQAIVEAAGGYLQSARNAATLLARHPYPTLTGGMLGGPWNWYAAGVVPDVELAPDAIVTSSIERTDGPDVNAVYVAGVSQGVRRLVKRTGSAANKLATMVTDPLMVAHEVALQRGTAILGAAGPKHLVRLDLPVLTGASQPGVLDVGQLVQVNAAQPWRGRVRSVGVSATFGRAVRQSVQIERHLEVTP